MSEFVPTRLAQARKAKKLNMTQLAERTGLTRQAISQFERKESRPSAQTLFRLAQELDVSETFFSKPHGILEREKEGPPSFRSMASATAKARAQAESYLEFSAFLCSELVRYIEITPARLPSFYLADFETVTDEEIEDFAEQTRRFFGIGDGPISDLTMLLENRGVVVTKAGIDARLEGLSQWYGDRPFVLIDERAYCARSRYSMAHELGHLILHRGLVNDLDMLDKATLKKIEHQADYFAGCFLLPESSFSAEFYRADWESLIRLKGRWLVSIAAMIMRLSALGLISDHRKQRLFQLINVKKARRVEPLDREIPIEQPRLFQRIAEVLSDNKLIDTSEWRHRVGLSASILSALTGLPESVLAGTRQEEMDDNIIYLRS